MKLERLKKVDLRGIWRNEASDFTNWLAEEENLELLSDEIGLDIKLIQTEANVGKFNVDILAEEENTGRKIVIENQLETTDHRHLGQIITYASGYDAEVIIWIVKDVNDEHKKAIDWLNEHTDEDINFFAIKMELWQIGDSSVAPKFQVISRPNDWAKTVKESTNKFNLSNTNIAQIDFWNKFKEYSTNKGTKLKLRKGRPQHWYDISLGSANAHISLTINSRDDLMGCEIYISDSKDLFYGLEAKKEDIERELGLRLEWMALEDKKASRIKIVKPADIDKVADWEQYFDWLKDTVEKFHKVFGKYIKIIK